MNQETQIPYYLIKLRSEFRKRVDKNSAYSLRAFSKHLDMNPSSLSSVLKGKRGVPVKKIALFVEKLELSPKEAQLFEKSALKRLSNRWEQLDAVKFKLDEEVHFNIISEWEHYALLSLIETKNFVSSVDWMSERLGISAMKTQECLDNLLYQKMISLEEGQFKLCQKGCVTTEDIPSKALRKARRQDLELAGECIDEVSVELRDLSSATFTMNKSQLGQLKKKIREFRKSFVQEAEQIPGDEVYKISVQLIPLTKLNQLKKNNKEKEI